MDYKQTDFSKFGADCFPGFVGIEVVQVTKKFGKARMEIKNLHFNSIVVNEIPLSGRL